MLTPYKVYIYISVDDAPKVQVMNIGYGLTDRELPCIITSHWSFQEVLTKQLPTPAITIGTTFFRKRPYVQVEYSWDAVDKYYHFDHITIERHYEPWKYATLQDIMKMTDAEDFIQYLKERGMTTCPILNK